MIGEKQDFKLLAKIANSFDDTFLPQKLDLSIHSKLNASRVA